MGASAKKKENTATLAPPSTAASELRSIHDLAVMVNRISGVQLGDRQKFMIEMRIQRRMMQLGLKSEPEYLKYFHLNRESETQALISLLTTHHTFFFRESMHFEFLEMTGIKKLVKAARERGDRKLRFWSAAATGSLDAGHGHSTLAATERPGRRFRNLRHGYR
jgi:hypothetical protein